MRGAAATSATQDAAGPGAGASQPAGGGERRHFPAPPPPPTPSSRMGIKAGLQDYQEDLFGIFNVIKVKVVAQPQMKSRAQPPPPPLLPAQIKFNSANSGQIKQQIQSVYINVEG